jgi:hypothetical protein
MITGHFAVALGTLGVLAFVAGNPHTWTATLTSQDGSSISGTARVEAPGAPTPVSPMDTTTPPPEPTPPTPRDTVEPRRDTLPPPTPSEGQAVPREFKDFRVTLNLSNAPQNTSLAWHIHQGKCGSNGAVVGPDTMYQPLQTDAQGTATATASITASIREKGDYYADVHSSSDTGSSVSACGNLEPQQTKADE